MLIVFVIANGILIYKLFKRKPIPQSIAPVFSPQNIAKPRTSVLVKWDCTGSTTSPDWPSKPRFIRPAGTFNTNNPLSMVSPISNDDNSIVFDQSGGTVFTVTLKSITYFYKTSDTGNPVNISIKQNPASETYAPVILVTTLVPNTLTYVDLSSVPVFKSNTADSFIPSFDNGSYDDGSFVVLEIELGGVPPIPPSYTLKPYDPKSNTLNPGEYMTYGQSLTSPDGVTQFTLQNGTLSIATSDTTTQTSITNVAYLINNFNGQLVFEDINFKWLSGDKIPFPESGNNIPGSTFQYNDTTQGFSYISPSPNPKVLGTLQYLSS